MASILNQPQPYYKPRFNNHDALFRFRKPNWDHDLWFYWNTDEQRYKYNNESYVSQEVLYAENLMIMPIKENTMKKNVNYIGTNYDVAEVTYDLSGDPLQMETYYFKTDVQLKARQLVVVESVNGMSLCRVVTDSVPRSLDTNVIKMFNKAKAWVVDVINEDAHEKRKLATERKKFIMDQLAERKEAMEEVAIYKLLAESDPEASKLLAELEDLSK